jgi:hypothetical protein
VGTFHFPDILLIIICLKKCGMALAQNILSAVATVPNISKYTDRDTIAGNYKTMRIHSIVMFWECGN